jgi:hypothetical protein
MQTSIEWLIEQLVEMDKQLDGRRKNEDATILKMNPTKIFDKAKKMHKQEIIDAVNEGIKEGYSDYIDTEWGRKHDYNPEQYYQETFKKD